MSNIILSVAVQLGIAVWGLFACHKKAESSFWDNESTNVIRGIFSILIVLFHVPVSNLFYNLLGCCTFVLIVTLFSLFSAYGLVIKASTDSTYIARLTKRIVRITCCYFAMLAIKSLVADNVLGGYFLA